MTIHLDSATFLKSAAEPKGFIRDGLPQIAFAGRSNVGKSSCINRLCRNQSLSRVSGTPGKTAHVNYFTLSGEKSRQPAAYLVDLPGYGFARVSDAEKERWGTLMEQYFAENDALRLVCVLVDARHEPKPDDLTMLSFVNGRYPFVVVANKCDKLKPSERPVLLDALRHTLRCPVLPFSAQSGEGKEELIRLILQSI